MHIKIKSILFKKQETIEANICTEDENIKLDAINEIVIKNIQSRTVHLDSQVDGIKNRTF